MSIIILIFVLLTLQPLKISNNLQQLLPVILEIELSGYQSSNGLFVYMGKIKDLTGQKFGKLTVLKLSNNRCNNGCLKWLCKCDCGNEKEISTSALNSGSTKSCGNHSRPKYKNIKNIEDFKKEYHILSPKELENKYKVCSRTIWKCGKELNLGNRKLRRNDVNDSYFSKENDCANKYYILGWIYTDGHLSKGINTVSITSMDLDLLEDIKKEIEYTGKIFRPKNKNVGVLYFNSKQIRKDLEGFGLTPRKTFSLKFPDIPEKYMGDFVRGLWDGDGTVGSYVEQVLSSKFVCASKDFIEELAKIIPVNNQKVYSRIRESGNLLYHISLSSHDSVRLRDFMYHDNTLFLKRKKDKFYNYTPKWKFQSAKN